MKKIGILTLTRQNSLAYTALKRIVTDLEFQPVCGEAIGVDSIYVSIEDATLKGHDFLGHFFKQVGFSECDILLLSAPYSANLFILPKIMRCLRMITNAPIIMGGNEASNNHRNIMQYRHAVFANRTVDIAPDFIVRGAAENALYTLLPLLDRNTMRGLWEKRFLRRLLDIPSLVFWLPNRRALYSTPFSSEPIPERTIFSHVRLGEKTVAITLQRACVWAKKSRGGCLFCAIASQFGERFHCAVKSDGFVDELLDLLTRNPDIQFVDVWDDTFNIDDKWALEICRHFERINRQLDKKIVYSCFLRPKGLTKALASQMEKANVKVAFLGVDALTEDLSKRMRRGCTISEINRSIQVLKEGKVLPRLSVQLFSPEATVDDVGITAALAASCIHKGESTVHVHLYTFPLFGSDIHRLLSARDNLKTIPTPLLRKKSGAGFRPYQLAFDYRNYDPDLEQIKKQTFTMLGVTSALFVKTYPGNDVDGQTLKAVLLKVREWCAEAKKKHPIKSLWVMLVLGLEDRSEGLDTARLLELLSRNDRTRDIPPPLQRPYGTFGYGYTLARSLQEVLDLLLENRMVRKTAQRKYRLTGQGIARLKSLPAAERDTPISVAAYGRVRVSDVLDALHRN